MVELLVVATVLVLVLVLVVVAGVGITVMVEAEGVPRGARTKLDAVDGALLLIVTAAGTTETRMEVEMDNAVATLTLLYVGTEVLLVVGEICINVGLELL